MSARVVFVPLAVMLVLLLMGMSGADEPTKNLPADKDLAARLVTLQEKDVSLADALKGLEKQTGIKVEDRRRDMDDKLKLKLNLDKATFWQSLDAIAKQADLRISLYERDRKLALVSHENGYRQFPTSFDGLFRTTVKRIVAIRDLEADEPVYIAHLEVSWEPRFQAVLLETKPDSMVVQIAKERTLKSPDEEKMPTPAGGRNSIEVPVRLPAIPRSAPQIELLKGELSIIGSPKTLTFVFDNLDKLTKDKLESKTQEGVTAKLNEFSVGKEIWTIGFRLEYPAEGPKFESFQSWLVNNQVFLEDKAGKRITHDGYEVSEEPGNKALIRYRFVNDEGKLGKPGDWKLIYLTPGAFFEIPIKFQFKEVPLH